MNKVFTILYVSVFGVSIILQGCFDRAPNFPDAPKITFKDVQYKDGTPPQDSLIVSLRYQDGTGDLGLDKRFKDEKYSERKYIRYRDGNNKIMYLSKKNKEDKNFRLIGFDMNTVHPYKEPYICTHWIKNPTINGQVIKDTIYYIPNPNVHNIFIKLFYRNQGSKDPFKEFDFLNEKTTTSDCGLPINGTFPVLKDPSESTAAIEGTLNYAILYAGFIPNFGNKQIKLEVHIQDRALNKSNVVTITGRPNNDNGEGFTLAQIKTN